MSVNTMNFEQAATVLNSIRKQVTGEDAIRRGAVGPMMRASGINVDMVIDFYYIYDQRILHNKI